MRLTFSQRWNELEIVKLKVNANISFCDTDCLSVPHIKNCSWKRDNVIKMPRMGTEKQKNSIEKDLRKKRFAFCSYTSVLHVCYKMSECDFNHGILQEWVKHSRDGMLYGDLLSMENLEMGITSH